VKTGVYHVVFRGSLLGIITPWSVPGVRESVCVTCRVVFVRVGASREAAARSGAPRGCDTLWSRGSCVRACCSLDHGCLGLLIVLESRCSTCTCLCPGCCVDRVVGS